SQMLSGMTCWKSLKRKATSMLTDGSQARTPTVCMPSIKEKARESPATEHLETPDIT
ncbi:hypothetical protein M9458_040665, partial [Cirrhinus mrigala]